MLDFDFVTLLPGGNLPSSCIDFAGNVSKILKGGVSDYRQTNGTQWYTIKTWEIKTHIPKMPLFVQPKNEPEILTQTRYVCYIYYHQIKQTKHKTIQFLYRL